MSTSIFNETFQHTEQSEDVDLFKKHSVFHPKHLKIIVLFFFSDRLYWKEAGNISQWGGGGQTGGCFQTKTPGWRHRWNAGVPVWAAAASHWASGSTADCLSGICCCSNTDFAYLTSPTYLLPVPILILNLQIHTACTCNRHRCTDTLSTPTHSQADNICKERGAETRGVFFSLSDLSVLVRSCDLSMMYESPGCLKVP